MATTLAPPERAPTPSPERRVLRDTPTPGDRVFRTLVVGSAWTVLAILGLIAFFLVFKSWPALDRAGWGFLTLWEWDPDISGVFGIVSMLYGTMMIAVIALAVGLPVAIGTSLFINEYAPARVGRTLVPVIDLLAAVPSLVYGMWGVYWLEPQLMGTTRWLTDHLGFIPIFGTARPVFGRSMFLCGLVVGLMVVPIITSVTREVMAQVPATTREGALALGGSRWGMIRRVVLPYSRGGVIGAAMLGLGRALGETIAIALILAFDYKVTTEILSPGGGSVAGLIALFFPEAGPAGVEALIAAGLALFVVTLLVNMGARVIVNRVGTARDLDR
jgi:phosphate transport system permease protein